ncbi:flagellin [Anoxybacillus sp. FSL W8-1294]|uniref:flagellin N-terminal helical domain-containing protein n=1 Tax=Anoxybacillus sp. FSL W8-1294 TaxID=2954655 RepID=UPI0030D14721
MRINHNIAALNTYRQLTIGNSNAAKNMEKLSSGLRINKAGDDAAGLAISEKMRGQIRGLEQASRNAQDGISLIQTAEGALNETHSILQRMRELAVQAANDTNVIQDRDALQEEMNQLAQEIDRIANTTQFNTQYLLNGNFSGNLQIGANEDQNLSISIRNMKATGTVLNVGTAATTASSVSEVAVVNETNEVITGKGNVNVSSYTQKDNLDIKVKVLTAPDGSGTNAVFEVTINGKKATINTGSDVASQNLTLDATNFDIFETGQSITINAQAAWSAGDEYNIKVVGKTTSVTGPNISSYTNAKAAITTIDNAIKEVSKERSTLGAWQNRLEHTINNLSTSAENLTAAESRIRDVDYALAA